MAWTNLSFPFGSTLSSTQMTQLDDNFDALAAGSSGAPTIQTAALANGIITNAKLGNGSVTETKLGSTVKPWILLDSASSSGASGSELLEGLSTSYDEYIVVGYNFYSSLAGGSTLVLQPMLSGGGAGTAQAIMTTLDSNPYSFFEIRFYNPEQTTVSKYCLINGYDRKAGAVISSVVAIAPASAIDAVRIDSGNTYTGELRLYGRKT